MNFVTPGSLPDKIAAHIGDNIIRMEIKPGEWIREEQIAREIGVSRGPIREALQILAKQRLVEIVPRRGARATGLSAGFIESLYDILTELWCLAARKGAQKIKSGERGLIIQALEKMRRHALEGDAGKFLDSQFEFGMLAIAIAQDDLLARILQDLWPNNRRMQYLSLSSRKQDLMNNLIFFEDIARHVQSGDADQVARTVRAFGENEKAFALKIAREQKLI